MMTSGSCPVLVCSEGSPKNPCACSLSDQKKLRLAPGDVLYREGETANSAFVILKGRIDIVRTLGDRQDVLHIARPGTVLGEMALIAPSQRLSDAIAGATSTLMSIEQRDFRRVLQEYPGIARRLQQHLALEFQAMVRRLEKALPSEE